jgi:hypothetical protein
MRISKAGWVQQNDGWPYLPSACGLPFVPKGVGPVSIIFEGLVGIDGLVEVVIEGFKALDKPGRSAIMASLTRRTRAYTQ